MRQKCAPMEYAGFAIKRLEKGVFLVSIDDDDHPNVMAMAWGFIGFQWSKPVFIAPVRTERYTYGLIDRAEEFAVCIQPESMDEDMMYCGTHSGRDTNKFADRDLKTFSLPSIRTPGIEGSVLIYECKVIHRASAEPHSSHVFFFGEILRVYHDDNYELS